MLNLLAVIIGVYLFFKTVEAAVFGYLSRGADRKGDRSEVSTVETSGGMEAAVS